LLITFSFLLVEFIILRPCFSGINEVLQTRYGFVGVTGR